MAIYVGLKCIDRTNSTITYSFFKSDGALYGTLMVDIESKEVCLVDAVDEIAKKIAFPRACHAIEKTFCQDDLPDELAYTA